MNRQNSLCLTTQKNISSKAIFSMVAMLLVCGMLIFTRAAFSQDDQFEPLAGEGKKCKIGQDYSFEYSFDKTPQMGTVILKIQVFDKSGNRDTSLKITGDTGMPTMRGHHDTGMVDFQQNKKGDYLLPVNIVMPGTWDVRMIFSKDGKPLYKGSINFDI
jgi:hypothetical protein